MTGILSMLAGLGSVLGSASTLLARQPTQRTRWMRWRGWPVFRVPLKLRAHWRASYGLGPDRLDARLSCAGGAGSLDGLTPKKKTSPAQRSRNGTLWNIHLWPLSSA